MLQLKSCPRCQGDVQVDRDWFGAYKKCLQCGWSLDSDDDNMSKLSQSINLTNSLTAIKRAS